MTNIPPADLHAVPDPPPLPRPFSTIPDRPDPNDVIASGWGDWVHDRLAGIATTTVALSLASQSVPTTGVYLTGSVALPAPIADRAVIVTACALWGTFGAQADFYVYVNAGAQGRIRWSASGTSTVITRHLLQPAGTAWTIQARIAPVAAAATFATAGASDLCYLSATVI